MTDSAFINDLVILFIQVIAYVGPFFLIPAVFKTGMGVFGNLVGMVNDRGRGLFDRNKKYRQGKMSSNWQKAKVGERYNNRGLNALTSRATTRGLGFGAKGSAAYQQKMANSGIGFGKSEEAQAIQHNDGALRALTYGSAIEAKQNMKKDFGMSDADIDSSIAAAQASGGFGRNRQLFAAAQLSRTGTGYDDMQQVAQTIARVSHGNSGQASALAGDINASTKQAGRYDLAPGFGTLNNLAQAEMNGGSFETVQPDGTTKTITSTMADYHKATVQAARGADAISLMRGKAKPFGQLTQSLGDHAEAQRLIMANSAVGSDAHNAAKDEFLQTMGQIDQLNQSKSYASAENQEHINKLMNSVSGASSQSLRDLTGIGDQSTMGPVTQAQAESQAKARARYNQTRAPRQSPNPNDPNLP